MSRITIVVPVLNGERYAPTISVCLKSLLLQTECEIAEIFVADGGSTDRTDRIVSELAAEFPIIKWITNPRKLQSAAVNMVAKIARRAGSDILIRADAHVSYPTNFVRDCVTALREHNATSVVVPMRTVGVSGFQRAVAATQNSRLGNGGSAHRSGGVSRFIDHGHHAAFDLDFFLRIGGYNESFSHNEDAELDVRAVQAGGGIWLCTDAIVDYYPRTTPLGLARQYFGHGKGRARTLLLHDLVPRVRQMAPLVILFAALATLLSPMYFGCALPFLAYLAICMAWSLAAAVRTGDPWLLTMGVAAMIMHLWWAAGFSKTCLNYLPKKEL